ncbi:DciA family protein [Streptomyces noursei]|uniref:DciA family protein n=1 Tax=Streptomyces noursei TaxID=1971 RepID=UPI001674FB35|nr:DUF721 domain-containing protein [Streptomyces noursei]MCZ1021236.1 DUF721 domain-containing protein [Streptomyces noursei]GGX53142.1 hypothetical protein GCM10010341_88050 [Streptomyces noursei]
MTTPTPEQPSGVDLARVALRAAQQAARKNGRATEARAPRRRTRASMADGRDPKGFGAVLQALIVERAWEVPTAGGSAVDLWPSVAGDKLAKHVFAVRFRKETHELQVQAESPAWLTQLRLEKPELLERFRTALGPEVVRDIVHRTPGRAAAPAPGLDPAETPPPSTSKPPATSRDTESSGYQRALAAHRESRAALCNERVLDERVPSPTLREPTEAFARELARAAPVLPAGASTRAQALARARRERAIRTNPSTPARTNRKGAPRA